MKGNKAVLTAQELEIMKIVWQLGTATVRDVYEELLKSRKIAYTTVMTMMGILEQKGRLTKEARDRAYVYSPTESQGQVVGSMVQEFVKRVFDGSAKPLLVHLAENKKISQKELEEVSELPEETATKAMIHFLTLQNLLSWAAQVSVIVLTGALLPKLFRLRHPRSHLAYCYLLLFACIALPLIQPWEHPVISGEGPPDPNTPPIAESAAATRGGGAGFAWSGIAGILLCGIAARACWFLAGLWQIRRYRNTSVPLYDPPGSVTLARRLVKQDAAVRISSNDMGPVTFGWRHPIILLPESFLALEEDAQCAILCHELLHVKRNDWLVTVIEEIIGACLWFHPAIWYLLGETKLAREQVVDAKVIRLTAAPDPYFDALLAMAGTQLARSPMPAPLFLRKRHLAQRLHALLAESPMAPLRLASSYLSMGAILACAGSVVFMSFPLLGEPVIKEDQSVIPLERPATPQAVQRTSMEGVFRVGGGVTPPHLIARVDPEYSDTAREDRIEGTVVVQGIVETDGRMSVMRVVRSLDPQLDRNAIRAMEQWRFDPGMLKGVPVPVEIHVEVNFNLG